jgi:two-component system, OmpR family, sensor histidine kinase BaeS
VARRRPLGLGGLWLRLALAFLLVSILPIVVETMLIATGLTSDVTAVARREEVGLAKAAAFTSGAAYRNVGWARADLHPVFDLASQAGASCEIRNQAGRVVGLSRGYASYPTAGEKTLPIVAATRVPSTDLDRIGRITVRFSQHALSALAMTFEAYRRQARILATVIAVSIALAVSVIAARLTIVPIEVALTAMRARAAGDRDYRISRVRAPGVLRELLESFNESSDAFDAMDRAQRNLVADVAHEVRTPVAVLRAETEALVDGISEPTPENLASLHVEVLRLARMVDGLQRLAAAGSAEIELKRRRCDLAEIAADVAGRLDDAFASADVTLITNLEPAVAVCDRDRIQAVVSNLLTNALKFTPAGGQVTVQTSRNGNHQAIVRVSDTGIGIPADELPNVTKRFFRGRRSAGMVGGSGIGMAMVAELVRAHHGHLAISSEEGKGTQVTFTLPLTGN